MTSQVGTPILIPMISFTRVVSGIVWIGSAVAIVFGIYHHLKIYDPFVLVSACIYVLVVVSTQWAHPNRKLTALLQLFMIVNMILNGFGTNGLYRTSLHYDDLVHFLSPAFLMFAGLMWQRIRQRPLWVAVVFSILISVGWEPTEIAFDYYFKTHTYGQTGQDLDTVYDIIMDLSGIIVAGLVYWKWEQPLLRWLRTGTRSN